MAKIDSSPSSQSSASCVRSVATATENMPAWSDEQVSLFHYSLKKAILMFYMFYFVIGVSKGFNNPNEEGTLDSGKLLHLLSECG